MKTLAIGEDNLISVGSTDSLLRGADDGATIADATINATLKSENLVTTIAGPISIPAIATPGLYQGVLPAATALVQDVFYWLEVTISGTANGFRRIKCQAGYHEETP